MEVQTQIGGTCYALNSKHGVPDKIQLLPAGRVEGRDGRVWSNHEPGEILKAFALNRGPLPIDYEHAMFLKKGEAIPAA
ncbi:MAG: hypothetical protein JKY49_15080, partial [Cohaesibacteraceae bacterium]|nr:hypothetical protein [Cohaesibacteraceae bacterium]